MGTAPRTARLTKKQRALYELLRARSGKPVSDAEILAATGWKPTSWRVYVNNGLYAPYLRSTGAGRYDVLLDGSVSETDFHRQITQSVTRKAPTGGLGHPLAKALVARSADNMILALETFNRPSLRNRLDGFAMLFCTAWEQLLKAEIIEAESETAVFRPAKPNRRRETLSLDECVERRIPDATDLVRRNIERIAEVRHQATHFIVPEIQAPFAYLFQAGVVNYAKRYRELTHAPFLPRANIGLLAVAGQGETIDAAALAHLYGDTLGAEIASYATTLEREIEKLDDERFAVRVEIRVRFASKKEGADVTLVQAAEAPASAVVLEKPVDPERTHPYRTRQLEQRVREKLGQPFSANDLQAVLLKEAWKKSDNKYHRLQRNPDTPKYSDDAVDEIVRLVSTGQGYLAGARASYVAHSRTKSKR